jgi:hypothetical protein
VRCECDNRNSRFCPRCGKDYDKRRIRQLEDALRSIAEFENCSGRPDIDLAREKAREALRNRPD